MLFSSPKRENRREEEKAFDERSAATRSGMTLRLFLFSFPRSGRCFLLSFSRSEQKSSRTRASSTLFDQNPSPADRPIDSSRIKKRKRKETARNRSLFFLRPPLRQHSPPLPPLPSLPSPPTNPNQPTLARLQARQGRPRDHPRGRRARALRAPHRRAAQDRPREARSQVLEEEARDALARQGQARGGRRHAPQEEVEIMVER